jgi:ABC-type multidrug transport system ATPase subunit
MDISFEQIQLKLKVKGNGGEARVLLDGSIRARCKPGRMLAIMGPSGSGKSSLLHALAGKIKHNSKLTLQGKRYLNGKQVKGGTLPAALIEQQVNFFPHMTVKETLEFRVDLLLEKSLGKKQRILLVKDLISSLNLQKAADTIVGNSKVRGISGTYMRTSICEYICKASIVCVCVCTCIFTNKKLTQVAHPHRRRTKTSLDCL